MKPTIENKCFQKLTTVGLGFILMLTVTMSTMAQGVAINTTGADPHASAAFEIESTTGGLLIPRMTQAQRSSINAPATGLMIFQTDGTAGFYYFNGTAWVTVGPDETDPVFNEWNKSTGISITESQISDLGNYIETEADPTVPDHVKSITSGDLTNWNTAYTHSTTTTGSVHGSTTVGDNLLRLTNPSTASFLRMNADNSVTALTADDVRTEIGAGTGDGTVTSVEAGNGMDFSAVPGTVTVTLGMPSTLSSSTTNNVTTTSHTHEVTTVLPSSASPGIMRASGSKEPGGFYAGTAAPTETIRLSYDGYFYATRLYDGGNRVYSAGYTNIGTGETNYAAGNHTHPDLGTVQSIATNNGITGGTITLTGTIGLTGQALALHNLGTNGIITRTGAETVATRTITAGTGINITNGDGVSGHPTISAETYEVGDYAHGGIVFWVTATGQHGLVCAKRDQSTGVRWYAGTNLFTMAYGNGPIAGEMNTTLIIGIQGRGDGSTYAARICNELVVTEYYSGGNRPYADWYLPSQDELNLMYQNRTIINTTATANGGDAFEDIYYWSSMEHDEFAAWAQHFGPGIQDVRSKSISTRVRAVRAF